MIAVSKLLKYFQEYVRFGWFRFKGERFFFCLQLFSDNYFAGNANLSFLIAFAIFIAEENSCQFIN